MNVERLGVFAAADSVCNFTLNDRLVEFAIGTGDDKLSGVVSVGDVVVDVPLVDDVGWVGIGLAR